MKCEQVQKALAAFLKGELASPERFMIQQHLADCDVCRSQLGRLTGQALQSLAASAEPSPQAWSRLQARVAQVPVAQMPMAKEARPSPDWLPQWLSRLAPGGRSTQTTLIAGDKTMKKRFALLAVAAVVAVAFAVFMTTQNVPAVSAQQILDRAAAAQSAVKAAPGINHIRTESYYNFDALQENSKGIKTIIDSYRDLRTGNFRNVTTNADTGKVLDAFAYDGVNTYSTKGPLDSASDEHLIIYRSPQSHERVADLNPGGEATVDFEQLFNDLRADPHVKLEGKGTWSDGRAVYILSTQQPGKYLRDLNSLQTKRMFFDAATYQLLEEQATFQKDGKEIVVVDVRYLINETLPATTPVAWDVSDLQGVTFTDDIERTQGDLLPEKITAQELAAHTHTGYILKTIPEGFNLEITAPPRQDHETSYVYIASYRTEANDYFVIQAGDAPEVLPSDAAEVYTTAAGLLVTFMREPEQSPDGKHYQMAAVKAPDGTVFSITSTLSRERVKALAEDLVVAK